MSNVKDDDRDFDDALNLTGHGRYNRMVLFSCCVTIVAASLDIFGFSVVVAASRCELGLTTSQVGVLVGSPFYGLVFSYPWGYFADSKGRRTAILLSTSVGFIFGAISSISVNWQMMLVTKAIGSSFTLSLFMLTLTYLGESVDSKKRNQFLFILNTMNIGGEVVSFGLAYFILPLSIAMFIPWLEITFRSWRLYTLVMSIPLGIGALMMLFLEESPKFLIDKGENDKAMEVLTNIFVTNGGNRDDFVIKPLNVKPYNDSSFCVEFVRHASPLFKPPLLWRSLQLFYLLSLACAISNVSIMWLPTMLDMVFKSISSGSSDIRFCDGFNNISQQIAANVTCNDTLSEETFISGASVSLFVAVLNLSVTKFASYRRIILISIFLLAGFSSVMVSVLRQPLASVVFYTLMQTTLVGIGSVSTYFVDLYPTSCRGLATSLGYMVARCSSLIGTTLVGAAGNSNCEMIFYVAASVAFSGTLVSLSLPSIKN
ncbi:unnamed protein product [Pieris macdunnoughi]|uniref:Major facilitator superfamily (MFS) profile domain-containing protein n=1 Tax=Pieris macdunnoughi TaxID=345717 RepID=A0A821Q436_9NEOP|nr:unnamed protein product [Pieris macdunnoughi]